MTVVGYSRSFGVTISQTDLASADADFSTFTNADIGTAASNRDVVVAIIYRASGAVTTSGVTIGGNAASAVVQANNAGGGNTMRCELWGLRVAAGATADIIVTPSAAVARYAIIVFAMYGASAVSPASASSTTNGGSLAVPAAGGAIAGVGDSGGAAAASWAGLTEATDTFVGGSMLASTAKDIFAAGSSPTITATLAGSVLPVFAMASWGP